jgi:chromosome segregation ATPase
MTAASGMLLRHLDAQSEESLRLREELCLSQQMHQRLVREHLEAEVRTASEMQELQTEVSFLRAERVRLTGETEVFQNELLSLRINLTDSQQQCQERERERNSLRSESTILMGTLAKIREEHEYIRSDLINSHEDRMNSLGLELLSMRLQVADLEEMVSIVLSIKSTQFKLWK